FGGGVICYSRLARCLGDDQPFYGLQSPGLEGECQPISDMAGLAAHHVAAMRSVQPHGPYLLGGWSFGGLVAFEIARQMHQQGDEVALLALFDAEPFFTRDTEADYINEAGEQAIFLMGLFGKVLPITAEQLAARSPDEQMLYMIDVAKKANQIPLDFGLSEARRWLKLLLAHRQAGLSYTPQPYAGPATPFAAAAARRSDEPVPTGGWEQFVTGKLQTRTVPGDHRSMMSEPNIEGLAAQLRHSIEEAGQELPGFTSGHELMATP